MKYRFETLEDARKFASTKIKQGYIVKQAISVVEMPSDYLETFSVLWEIDDE